MADSEVDQTESSQSKGDRLISMLDHIEKRVEALRDHARTLDEERDVLLNLLHTVQSHKDMDLITAAEREELGITFERILSRCLSVEVNISTIRSELQQQALDKTNRMLRELSLKVQNNVIGCKDLVELYLNACLSDATGPFDQNFQKLLLECTVDDQKKIRKRLQDYMQLIKKTESALKESSLTVD
ncbi:BAG family molecular chaperone regulator 2-like [Glandiceps talaboti]